MRAGTKRDAAFAKVTLAVLSSLLWIFATAGAADADPKLLLLAREHFNQYKDNHLTAENEDFFRAVAKGKAKEYGLSSGGPMDLGNARGWPEGRTVRSVWIAWLCTDHEASKLVTSRGINIAGAAIDGELNLDGARIPFPLVIRQCVFLGYLSLQEAQLEELDLGGSHIKGLEARGAQIAANVFLDKGFESETEMGFHEAAIGKDLDCRGGHVSNADGLALDAEGARITGNVFLNKSAGADGKVFDASGGVSLRSATIGGELDLRGSYIGGLSANGAQVGGSVFLGNGFQSEGGVSFQGAAIGGDMDCTGGHLSNPNGTALCAEGAKITGNVFLNGGASDGRVFDADGAVTFLGAVIGGKLDLRGSHIKGFAAYGARIGGDVFMGNGSESQGEVSFYRSTIGGNLDLRGCHITGLAAHDVKVAGNVFLDIGFECQGQVSFYGATIGGDMDCRGGRMSSPTGPALYAEGAKITGSVFLGKSVRADAGIFESKGEVNFYEATIGGDMDCGGGRMSNPAGPALSAEGAKIGGTLFMNKSPGAGDNAFEADGEVILYQAIIGRDLNCRAGHMKGLSAYGAQIGGNVFADGGFESNGKVNFYGATIVKDLNLEGGHLSNPGGPALFADGAKIGGSVFMGGIAGADGRNFQADGEVRFPGATIGGDLNCRRSHLKGLAAYGAQIAGNVVGDNGFESTGEVNFSGATIGRDVDFRGSHLSNPAGSALFADWAKIGGGIFLGRMPGANGKSFQADGEVRFLGAAIGGDLDCSGGRLNNPGRVALDAERSRINGTVFLRREIEEGKPKNSGVDFEADGDVCFLLASIGGNLCCDGGGFNGRSQALWVERAKITGSVSLRGGFTSNGEVNLDGVTMGGSLLCRDSAFLNANSQALSVRNARIGGDVDLTGNFMAKGCVNLGNSEVSGSLNAGDLQWPEKAVFDFESARVGTLNDSKASWGSNPIVLDGFVYNRIFGGSPMDAASRLEWLGQMQSDRFLPQPYEQLATVLRKMGREGEAAKVVAAMNAEHRRFINEQLGRDEQGNVRPFLAAWAMRLTAKDWWRYNVLNTVMNYAHRPGAVFYSSLAVLMIACGAFKFGHSRGQMCLVGQKGADEPECD